MVLSIIVADCRETALINSEPDVLADIVEAEQELDAGGGKPWISRLRSEIDNRVDTLIKKVSELRR